MGDLGYGAYGVWEVEGVWGMDCRGYSAYREWAVGGHRGKEVCGDQFLLHSRAI